MKRRGHRVQPWMGVVGALAAGILIATTGCQVEMGGQTLPSPYYMQDDVQYYAPGPEFRLAREAAALKAARGEVLPPPGGGAGVQPPAGGAVPQVERAGPPAGQVPPAGGGIVP